MLDNYRITTTKNKNMETRRYRVSSGSDPSSLTGSWWAGIMRRLEMRWRQVAGSHALGTKLRKCPVLPCSTFLSGAFACSGLTPE